LRYINGDIVAKYNVLLAYDRGCATFDGDKLAFAEGANVLYSPSGSLDTEEDVSLALVLYCRKVKDSPCHLLYTSLIPRSNAIKDVAATQIKYSQIVSAKQVTKATTSNRDSVIDKIIEEFDHDITVPLEDCDIHEMFGSDEDDECHDLDTSI
jgi:hypothetical protein